jgi:hypothetical protein
MGPQVPKAWKGRSINIEIRKNLIRRKQLYCMWQIRLEMNLLACVDWWRQENFQNSTMIADVADGKTLDYNTKRIHPLFLALLELYSLQLIRAIIHCFPSIHFSRRQHRNARRRNKTEESIGPFCTKPHLQFEDTRYQNCRETQQGIFSWRWLEVKIRSCWSHHQLWENPNLSSILSIYPFAFPTLCKQYLQLVWLRLGRWPLVSGSITEFVSVRRGEVVKNSRSTRAYS